MRVFNQQIASVQPMNVSFNSSYVPLKSIYGYNMAVIITGVPTGSLSLQASNDPETNDTQINSTGVPPSTEPTNWVTILNSPVTVSSAGETMWNVSFVEYNYVRVAYTDSSGGTSTATAKIIFNGKGV